MPDLHDLLKARLAMARQDLWKVLDHLTDADVTWAPAEGMRTIGGQLYEISGKETEIIVWLQTGEWPDPEHDPFDKNAPLAHMKAVLEANRVATWAYMDSLSENELRAIHPVPQGWWEGLRLTECPRDEILRNIAVHEWYHTGQLITYLWIKGDDPYNW
jgi:uncharacterized damage-inducible protein DinB